MEVAEQVRDIMLREGFSMENHSGKEKLTLSRVKGWIASFAPQYAREPGRRKASE